MLEIKPILKFGLISFCILVILIAVFSLFLSDKIIYPDIFLQLEFYDVNDNFIGYNEDKVTVFYPNQVIDWLELRAQKEIIIENGLKYEILKFEDRLTMSDSPSLGGYYLMLPIDGKLVVAMNFPLDSFHFKHGDYAKIFWTVIHPLS